MLKVLTSSNQIMSSYNTTSDKSNNGSVSNNIKEASCADSVLSGSNILPPSLNRVNYHHGSHINSQHHLNNGGHNSPPLRVPTIVNATKISSKRSADDTTGGLLAMEREREQILNAPLPPLLATTGSTIAGKQTAIDPDKTSKRSSKTAASKSSAKKNGKAIQKQTSKETCKRGRRSDPRMNRAVAARLANPIMSLLDALKLGGFDFPHLEPNRMGNPSTKDADNVQLAQRKNQLSRRLRQARAAMDKDGGGGVGCSGLASDNGLGGMGEDQISDVESSRTGSTPGDYKRRSRRTGKYRRERKGSKCRKDRGRGPSRKSRYRDSRKRSKSRKDRKRSSRDYDATTDDTEHDSSDSSSSSSSSNSSYSSSSSSSSSEPGKNNHKGSNNRSSSNKHLNPSSNDDGMDNQGSRKHKNRKTAKQSRKAQKAAKGVVVPPVAHPATTQAAFLQQLQQQSGQRFLPLRQDLAAQQQLFNPHARHPGGAALALAGNVQYLNSMLNQQQQQPITIQGHNAMQQSHNSAQVQTNPSPLPQHTFMSAPPKKKIKHRSGDSVASGSVASQSIASASLASTLNSKRDYSMGSSLPSNLFSATSGSINNTASNPPVPYLGITKDRVDGMKQAASLFTSETADANRNATNQQQQQQQQQSQGFDQDPVSNDPKMIQALDYYRSESSNLYKRCLIMVGYNTVETEECDQIYLNFAAKAIRDDIIRWKRLRSFYLQCQLMNSASGSAQKNSSNVNAPRQQPQSSFARHPTLITQQSQSTSAQSRKSEEHNHHQVNNNSTVLPSSSQQPRKAKSDESSANRSVSMFSKNKIMAKEHYQRHNMAAPSTTAMDADTTSHDRTEESEFTKQLEDIDTVSQLSNFDTISDFGSKNSYFSRHIHRLLGKSGPPPPKGNGGQQQQHLPSSQKQRHTSLGESNGNKFDMHKLNGAPTMQPVVSGGDLAKVGSAHSNKWPNAKSMDSFSMCSESRTTSEDKSSSGMKSTIEMVIVDGKPNTNSSSMSRQSQQQPSSSQSSKPSTTTPSAGSNDTNSNNSNNNEEKQPSSSQKSEWNSDLLNVSEEQGDGVLTGLMKFSS